MSGPLRDGMAVPRCSGLSPIMSTPLKTPTLRTRNVGSIVSSCAALAVSVFLAGGMWLVMR